MALFTIETTELVRVTRTYEAQAATEAEAIQQVRDLTAEFIDEVNSESLKIERIHVVAREEEE